MTPCYLRNAQEARRERFRPHPYTVTVGRCSWRLGMFGEFVSLFSFLEAASKHTPCSWSSVQMCVHVCVCTGSCSCFSGSVKVDLMSSEAAHQIRGQQRLKVKEQPYAGNLLQPASAGLLDLLKVLGVQAIRARLSACTVELKAETEI